MSAIFFFYLLLFNFIFGEIYFVLMAFVFRRLRTFSSIGRKFHTGDSLTVQRLPTPWELVTGFERWEAIQFGKGNVDPFFMLPLKRGKGTKDCPNVVMSPYNKRVVACLCHDDNNHFIYFWLHEGYPRRCLCNYWFVLERFQMPKVYEDCEE